MLSKVKDAPRETARERRTFESVRRAEADYANKLRKIARHVGDLVRAYAPIDPLRMPELHEALRRYADLIRPWAQSASARMLVDVSRRDEQVWAGLGREMSSALRSEIQGAPTGEMFRALQAEQVDLITSLPLQAAQRVHELALKAREDSTRAEELAREILRTGHVTVSRANMIARTEVGRVATNLTMARAEYIGSDGYVWRTSKDSDVRPSHRKMEGRFVKWSDPPTLDNLTGHAGALPNCRCYPEPVIPKFD